MPNDSSINVCIFSSNHKICNIFGNILKKSVTLSGRRCNRFVVCTEFLSSRRGRHSFIRSSGLKNPIFLSNILVICHSFIRTLGFKNQIFFVKSFLTTLSRLSRNSNPRFQFHISVLLSFMFLQPPANETTHFQLFQLH